MRTRLTESIKSAVRPAIFRAAHPGKTRYHCPVCGYRGPFKDKLISREPRVERTDSKCPRCASVERHRLTWFVLDDLFKSWDPTGKALLHVAPEFCLQPRLRRAFGTYHTTDLFRTDVDFQWDLQDLPCDSASYDCVFVSRVLTIPPDLDACVHQMRRILRPGGLAIISEYFIGDETIPDPRPETEACREMGMDLIPRLKQDFARVECPIADAYPAEAQMINRILHDGKPMDDFPDAVRAPGVGAKEMLLLCWATGTSER